MTPRHTNSGFTLLEMTVSVALFSVMVLITVSVLISLSQEAKKAQANRTVIGNLGATIESMARGIRMGRDFVCNPTSLPLSATAMPSDQSCLMSNANGTGGSSSAGFAYVPIQQGSPLPIVFRRNPSNGGYIERSVDGGVNFQRFTAEEIAIERLTFFVSQVNAGEQPMITMLIGGTTDINQPTESRFDIQMTVTARTPNL